MKKYTYVPGSFIAAWLIWELIVRLGGFNEALLPTPYKVLVGFGELIGDGVLFKDIADSLVRFFIGYIISVVAGVFFGLILGWYKGIWNYINPIVQVIRPISPVAWLPFIVLFFGIGQAPASANPGRVQTIIPVNIIDRTDRTSASFVNIRNHIFEQFQLAKEDKIEFYI